MSKFDKLGCWHWEQKQCTRSLQVIKVNEIKSDFFNMWDIPAANTLQAKCNKVQNKKNRAFTL